MNHCKQLNKTFIWLKEVKNIHKEVKGNFSDTFPTWVIAYCIDTDSFFCTNQRHFFWESEEEFQCENDGIIYFEKYLNKFRETRSRIANDCGGIRADGELFLENTNKKY